jgi:hypothetical protein
MPLVAPSLGQAFQRGSCLSSVPHSVLPVGEQYEAHGLQRGSQVSERASVDDWIQPAYHMLSSGQHRLAVAPSLGRKLFWKDTGEPLKLDPFFKGSSHRPTA